MITESTQQMTDTSTSTLSPSLDDAQATETKLPEPGVFTIDHSPEADARAGAVATAWDQSIDDETDLDSLPMIVWLRGDEPWFPQFDLDADQVMKQLGIKRSRLTQISGKELRVGRVRVDRYIRPIYRSSDVESYLSWTRATASHQKSSSAIKDAVDALQQQGSQIAEVVSQASSHFADALKSGLLQELEEAATRSIRNLADEVQRSSSQWQASLQEFDQLHERRTSLVTTQMSAQDMRLDGVESTLAAVALRVSEVNDRFVQILDHQSRTLETVDRLMKICMQQAEVIASLGNRGDQFTRQRATKKKATSVVNSVAERPLKSRGVKRRRPPML